MADGPLDIPTDQERPGPLDQSAQQLSSRKTLYAEAEYRYKILSRRLDQDERRHLRFAKNAELLIPTIFALLEVPLTISHAPEIPWRLWRITLFGKACHPALFIAAGTFLVSIILSAASAHYQLAYKCEKEWEMKRKSLDTIGMLLLLQQETPEAIQVRITTLEQEVTTLAAQEYKRATLAQKRSRWGLFFAIVCVVQLGSSGIIERWEGSQPSQTTPNATNLATSTIPPKEQRAVNVTPP